MTERRNAKEEFTVWDSPGKGGLLHEGRPAVPPEEPGQPPEIPPEVNE